MADDLMLDWDTDLMQGDLVIDNGDLQHDKGLESAVRISLFSDRRANDDDELLDSNNLDKRGWWGDLVSPEVEEDKIGSRLWLLGRAKTTTENLVKAKEYSEEALLWMIEDRVVSDIIIDTERNNYTNGAWLVIKVQIVKINGDILNLRYEKQWDEQTS
jgi:phage gp46-like protein